MRDDEPVPAMPTNHVEALFDRAIEVNGFLPRFAGETIEKYLSRKEWGPLTVQNLAIAAEAAAHLDKQQAVSSVASARDHHDDPNPPDSKPRKK